MEGKKKMKKVKNILWVIALLVIIVLIGIVGFNFYKKATMEVKNPIVTMEVENFGTIKMELYPEQAPETVANFITLANRGFYNGLTFHRVVKDFMIQGGDKEGTGQGSATLADLKDDGDSNTDYSIKGEFVANGVNNTLKFDEGVIGMARNDYTQYSSSLKEESYNSGSSQFFIMTKANTSLNGYYTAFGKVTEGMDVVHKIENVEVKAADSTSDSSSSNTEVSTPVETVKISSVTVDTQGIDYGLPNTLTPFNYMSWLYKQYGINK
jgi:peptidyl-prolyl cis-trans isomerase